jgi:cell division protein FtsB
MILVGLSIIFLLSFYVFQIQAITKMSFNIATYEKKLAGLSQENKNLETDFSRFNSPENFESLLKNSQYELVQRVHYIQISENQVVVKTR